MVEAVANEEHDWEPVRTSDEWVQWTRLALKLGETADSEASFLITTLNTMSAVLYAKDSKSISFLTEMVMSHSQFLSVMLAKRSKSKSKFLLFIIFYYWILNVQLLKDLPVG